MPARQTITTKFNAGLIPTALSPLSLPLHVDGEPALLRLMLKEQAGDRLNIRVIGWEEFFCKFDALGLSLVYDNDLTGYNEILQRDEHSPYRHPDHRPEALQN